MDWPNSLKVRVVSPGDSAPLTNNQGAFLQRYTVNKVLAVNVLLWGIVTACTSAVQNSAELLALRTILGIFESVVTPSLILITAAWYRRQEGAPRFGIWFCGLGAGQIVGGLISFGAQHSTTKVQGWRLMFLVIGVLNVIISVFIWRLPASPEQATFLTPLEADFVQQRLRDDHAGVGPKVMRRRSVWETFLDLQTWLLCLITVLTTLSSGFVTYYSVVIIQAWGYNSKQAALLNMPSGLVSIIATLGVVYTVSYGWQRWMAIVIACIPPMIGACLMVALPETSKPGLLLGVYLINTAPAVYVLVLSTASANYRGYTRKIAGGAILAASFSIGNLVSPQTFQARDAPQYIPAKITLIVAMAAAIVVALLLRVLYGVRNARADKYEQPAMSRIERNAVLGARAFLDFGDTEYRYSY
jgi:MFS family permease